MGAGTDAAGQTVAGRWRTPPWNDASPEGIALAEQLPRDHPARWINEVVGELDRAGLAQREAGVGRQAVPPDFLWKAVWFEMACPNRLRPAPGTRAGRELGPVRWLLVGLEPSRTCLDNFRDRVGAELDHGPHQVLGQAQAEGFTPAERAAIDGSFTAADGSRHRLLTAQTLAKRWPQRDAALAVDRQQAAAAGSSLVEQVLAVLEPTAAAPPTGAAEPGATPALAPPPAAVVPTQDPAVPTAPPSAAAPAAAADPTSQPAAAGAPPESAASPRPRWLATTPGGRRQQRPQYQRARQRMHERQARHPQDNRQRRQRQRRAIERLVVRPTEPEAALGIDKRKTFRPLYHVPLVYDLESPFVLGHPVFAAVTAHQLLVPVAERTQHLSGRPRRQRLGDAIEARVLDLVWCAKPHRTRSSSAGLDPTPPAGPGKRPPKQLPTSALTWLPEPETYRCPEGHLLELDRTSQEGRGARQPLTVLP
jgi:transposase